MSTVWERPALRHSRPTLRWLVASLFAASLVSGVDAYCRLSALDRVLQRRSAHVASLYEQRCELVGDLLSTAGSGAPDGSSTIALALARAAAGVRSVPPEALGDVPWDPGTLALFRRRQALLSVALARFLTAVDHDAALRSSPRLRAVRARLDDIEYRIAAARVRFDEAVDDFNTIREALPNALFVALFGPRFVDKPHFDAPPDAAAGRIVWAR